VKENNVRPRAYLQFAVGVWLFLTGLSVGCTNSSPPARISGVDATESLEKRDEHVEAENGHTSPNDVISMPADELVQTFNEDPQAAAQKFGGKTIELTGYVTGVGVDLSDNGYIYIGGEVKSNQGVKLATQEKEPWLRQFPFNRLSSLGPTTQYPGTTSSRSLESQGIG
jgi:hypothetical protein